MFRLLRSSVAILPTLLLTSCINFPLFLCTSVPNQIAMWFPFDDNALSGLTKDIATGNDANVTTTGSGNVGGLTVLGRGNAYAFDQQTRSNGLRRISHITYYGSTAANFGTTKNFTIDFWVYVSGCPEPALRGRRASRGAKNSPGQCRHTIMGNGGYHVPGWRIDAYQQLGSITVALIFGQAPNNVIVAQGQIQPNRWTHVTFTVDRSGPASTYINGHLSNAGNISTNAINVSSPDPVAQPFVISAGYFAPNQPHKPSFIGYLDEIEISDEILPASKVFAIWLGGKCR